MTVQTSIYLILLLLEDCKHLRLRPHIWYLVQLVFLLQLSPLHLLVISNLDFQLLFCMSDAFFDSTLPHIQSMNQHYCDHLVAGVMEAMWGSVYFPKTLWHMTGLGIGLTACVKEEPTLPTRSWPPYTFCKQTKQKVKPCDILCNCTVSNFTHI